MDAASNTSLTSQFLIPGEFAQFAVRVIPTSAWCITATCNVRLLATDSQSGTTFYPVGYSNNPSTSTSGFPLWEIPQSATLSGGVVIAEGLGFAKWGKFQFTKTATAATAFIVYGRKYD